MKYRVVLLTVVLAILTGAHPAARRQQAVELEVSHETAPPGGIAQIKIDLTEPKPISTGLFKVSGDLGELAGVSIFSPLGDAFGVAIPGPGGLRIVANSSLASLGTGNSDYPMLTLTVKVPTTAVAGTVFPISFDPGALTLTGPGGEKYVATIKPGSLTVGEMPAVEDVIPGSSEVPAGGKVTVLGRGFTPDVELDIENVVISQMQFVSPEELTLTLGTTAVMHGARFRLRLDEGDIETFYFSYQKTTNAFTSKNALLQSIEPVPAFPGATLRTVTFPGATSPATQAQVLVVKNSHLEAVTMQITRAMSGKVESAPGLLLPAASRLVLGVDEIFGSSCATTCVVKVQASSNVQAMGILGNPSLTRLRIINAK